MIERSTPTFLPLTLVRASGLPLHTWKALENSAIRLDVNNPEIIRIQSVQLAFDDALQQTPPSDFRTSLYNARKRFFQQEKLPPPAVWAVWATFPHTAQLISACADWAEFLAQKQAVEADFELKLQENYQFLQQMAQNKPLLRGLLFSSHDLLHELPALAQKPVAQWQAKDRKTALSLLQYLTRMGFKTSPRSHFTTVSVHPLDAAQTEREGVGEWFEEKISVAPNVALLPLLYDVLLQEPAFYRSLQMGLNPSVGIEDTSMNPGTWLYFDGEREAFQQMAPHPAMQAMLEILLKNGLKCSFSTLKQALSEDFEAEDSELESLILQGVSVGLLEWQWPEMGLSSSWCSGLYQYLGYLPAAPMITEAAYLLQWLRTTARTLPFQSLEDAQQAQRDTWQELERFFQAYGAEMPPIRVEDVFLEDVVRQHPLPLPPEVLEEMVQQLSDCWSEQATQLLPPFRSRLWSFAESQLKEGQVLDFLTFSQQFMSADTASSAPKYGPRYAGKMGALLQVFQENGRYKSVVNGLFPGGGKLFARWKSAFTQAQWETLQTWMSDHPSGTGAFPWQGWSNANFQPPIPGLALRVPGGRVGASDAKKEVLLAELGILKKADGSLHLIEKKSQSPLFLLDLGLESSETRPPVMQILWQLATPYVSLDALLPSGVAWTEHNGFRQHARVERQDITLARATWDLAPECWGGLFLKEKKAPARCMQGALHLLKMGIPQRFFGHFLEKKREKPQYYDLRCPVSLILLEKNMRSGAGYFRITEMLPLPEQTPSAYVAEYVFEWAGG